jgi:nucleoside-diphosphate-sugar epimerase
VADGTRSRRILIFGASGRTGGHAVDYALSASKQLEVVALVRKPLKARPGLTVVQGTPAELGDVQRAIEGCEAVLSFLSPRASGRAGAFTPHLISLATGNAITAMKAHGVRRIVVLSAHGVGDSFTQLPAPARWFVEHSKLQRVFADHANAESLLAASDLDWTSVRPVLLAGRGLSRTRLSEGGQPRPSSFISRETVATFMIDCLLHPEYFAKALTASRA